MGTNRRVNIELGSDLQDEYEYWSSKASRSRRGPAGKFRDYFETVGSKFSSLNELKFARDQGAGHGMPNLWQNGCVI